MRPDDGFYPLVQFPVAMRISSILVNSPRQKQLDDIMQVFEPYLREIYAYQRRRKVKVVK